MVNLTEAQTNAWAELEGIFGPIDKAWVEVVDESMGQEFKLLCLAWADGRRRYVRSDGRLVTWQKIVDETPQA